ncbi:LacI family DNA-binding transcriptional regulator [Propionimicrobium lymphophilum]|uniref:HTH lacI-type domain-containing protein n=1 Tax=Propionimicrobium lymphophilum ACS-093-V-SCH5 TaxID=883161 RepID=S2X0D2_9ACTN|nr:MULTISPECIES: LacI family DNA-binding transcriptional regulator [Propionimicrobium]EPD33449.1 hypothetical protein HMPREF9306_00989 [Propionimicrobium lymphophilum ACS-093-V-SCH5]ETJ98122.1 periplasmic-binding protein-like domain protein [Propionimicrobium sp. BV2F7]MDK7709828.1 LacI family DNA-binding transcriptional regulator [Propionimicrobium lymphophilum]MDK7733910.1 LacI family DNA-binding transcriptional regulator [Propionimicrobium lymphophilum]
MTQRRSEDDKPATIYDVAEAAGVSPSTVSRAFSRPGRVSSKTAAKIHQVAAEIGYRTEQVTRTVPSSKTKLIGVAVTDVTNPFFFSIIRGAEHVANKRGYSILLVDTEESSDLERQLHERTSPVLDGLIIATSRVSDTALRSVAKEVQTVVLNRMVAGLPCVITDNARGMRRALEHLAEMGHRRVCYVAGPSASWADGARWRAFREGCFELELIDHKIGPVAPTVRGGYSVFKRVMEQRVSAAICYNDMIGIGLSRAAKDAGFVVPGDLSVIGFDNTFASDLVTPGLTTVAAPLAQLGEGATKIALALINKEPARLPPSNSVVLPMKLIVRESTGPIRRTRIDTRNARLR